MDDPTEISTHVSLYANSKGCQRQIKFQLFPPSSRSTSSEMTTIYALQKNCLLTTQSALPVIKIQEDKNINSKTTSRNVYIILETINCRSAYEACICAYMIALALQRSFFCDSMDK